MLKKVIANLAGSLYQREASPTFVLQDGVLVPNETLVNARHHNGKLVFDQGYENNKAHLIAGGGYPVVNVSSSNDCSIGLLELPGYVLAQAIDFDNGIKYIALDWRAGYGIWSVVGSVVTRIIDTDGYQVSCLYFDSGKLFYSSNENKIREYVISSGVNSVIYSDFASGLVVHANGLIYYVAGNRFYSLSELGVNTELYFHPTDSNFHNIAIGPSNVIYIASSTHVYQTDTTASIFTSIATLVDQPEGICYASNGYVYAAMAWLNEIDKISSSGVITKIADVDMPIAIIADNSKLYYGFWSTYKGLGEMVII